MYKILSTKDIDKKIIKIMFFSLPPNSC